MCLPLANSGTAAIERSPVAEYQSAFEQLGFTPTVARELVERFVLVDGCPEWPHVVPYECAISAIRSRAAELQHLESIPCITALASDIAQYGFAPHTCESFARRIEGSGAAHDRRLSEWLICFIRESRLRRVPLPVGVQYGERTQIDSCRSRDARQIWLKPDGSDDYYKDLIHKQLEIRLGGESVTHADNEQTILLFHGTSHGAALRIATAGINPLAGTPYKDLSPGRDTNQAVAVPNRGGFYLFRFLPAAYRWARENFPDEPAVLVYMVQPRAFTYLPVRTYDFFNNHTDANWQATLRYFRGGCEVPMQVHPHPTEAADAAGLTTADGIEGLDSFHCLVGPRSDGKLESGRGWKGWRKRALYSGRALQDAFARQVNDNNEQYCIKAPHGDLQLARRLDSCLLLIVYM